LNKEPFEHKEEASEISRRAHSLLNISLYVERNKTLDFSKFCKKMSLFYFQNWPSGLNFQHHRARQWALQKKNCLWSGQVGNQISCGGLCHQYYKVYLSLLSTAVYIYSSLNISFSTPQRIKTKEKYMKLKGCRSDDVLITGTA